MLARIAEPPAPAERVMTTTQKEKAEAFRALHRGACFVMPKPWDAGSAVALAGLGFAALATSSGAAVAR